MVPLTGLDAAASSMHGMVIASSESALSAAQTFMRLLQGPVNNIVLEASKPDTRALFESQDWLSLLTVQARSPSSALRTGAAPRTVGPLSIVAFGRNCWVLQVYLLGV